MSHIALFIHGLSGGGVQRSTMNLAGELRRRGHRVDLVVGTADGAARSLIPDGVTLRPLRRSSRLKFLPLAWRAEPTAREQMLKPVLLAPIPQKAMYYLPALLDYLQYHKPDGLIAADTYCNIAAIWARKLSGERTRVVVSERNPLSVQLQRPERRRAWRWRHAPALIGLVYPQADGIISVSRGVGDDLTAMTGIARDRITTIYNPIHIGDELDRRAAAPVNHHWFRAGEPPVILGVGRLVKPKDFPTLIRAFAQLRRTRAARLLILGEEQEPGLQQHLGQLARELGIAEAVQLPGHVENPYAYMRQAALFALSSYREGLGNVLIEALSCGCPVVSTDCPYGPAEILERGRYGRLVPVGDTNALAAAMAATLDAPPTREHLRARGREFGVERAASAYLSTLGLPAA